MFNLIQNAVNFNQNENGDLIVLMKLNNYNQGNSRNKLYGLESSSQLVIEVIDTGDGIDPLKQNYLFVPFHELD